MTPESNLKRAIDYVTKATEEDRNKNYEEAVTLYKRGIVCFILAIKYEAQGDKAKEAIKAKCASYVERAVKIKGFIAKTDNGQLIYLKQGIELVTKATEEDRNKNYEEALRLYEQGVENLILARLYEAEGDKAKEAIRTKCAAYSERAKKIREALQNWDDQKSLVQEAKELKIQKRKLFWRNCKNACSAPWKKIKSLFSHLVMCKLKREKFPGNVSNSKRDLLSEE